MLIFSHYIIFKDVQQKVNEKNKLHAVWEGKRWRMGNVLRHDDLLHEIIEEEGKDYRYYMK